MIIYLNPLSACDQCKSIQEANEYISNITEIFEYAGEAIRRTITLYVDPIIESRGLVKNESFLQTINTAPISRDLLRQWMLYTKNRAVSFLELPETTVLEYNEHRIEGEVSSDDRKRGAHWLSFPHVAIPSGCDVQITSHGPSYSALYISDLEEFKRRLPSYEPNPKHRVDPYYRAGGEYVSEMDLADDAALRTLLCSYQVRQGRFAFAPITQKYYRFLKTYPNRNVYHGFVVQRSDIPKIALRQIEDL